jgi:hypothetical protein
VHAQVDERHGGILGIGRSHTPPGRTRFHTRKQVFL